MTLVCEPRRSWLPSKFLHSLILVCHTFALPILRREVLDSDEACALNAEFVQIEGVAPSELGIDRDGLLGRVGVHDSPTGAASAGALGCSFFFARKGVPGLTVLAAVIIARNTIRTLLDHLGLSSERPTLASATAPLPERLKRHASRPTWSKSSRLLAYSSAVWPSTPTAPSLRVRFVVDWGYMATVGAGGEY